MIDKLINDGYEMIVGTGDCVIPITQWGKDHWSTLLYLECRTVDNSGVIDNRHMRCNQLLHSMFMYFDDYTIQPDGSMYPTVLRNKVKVDMHDDWSCMRDMIELGLCRACYKESETGLRPTKVVVELTLLGCTYAAAVRKHKSNGGVYSTFSCEESK